MSTLDCQEEGISETLPVSENPFGVALSFLPFSLRIILAQLACTPIQPHYTDPMWGHYSIEYLSDLPSLMLGTASWMTSSRVYIPPKLSNFNSITIIMSSWCDFLIFIFLFHSPTLLHPSLLNDAILILAHSASWSHQPLANLYEKKVLRFRLVELIKCTPKL